MKNASLTRFWAKVAIREPDECWEWTGCKNTYGYGHTRYEGRQVSAHIVAMKLSGVTVDKGQQVLHKCDNRACVNPEHLFLGTHQDNMTDRNNKKRQARGSRQGNTDLCELDVWLIRNLKAPQTKIADFFGITQAAVSAIVTRKNWRHV